MALTKRQKQVLDFLAEFIAENHYSPSFEEIAQNMNLSSVATVHKHLQVLQEKGYLERSFNRSRALENLAEVLRRDACQPAEALLVPQGAGMS